MFSTKNVGKSDIFQSIALINTVTCVKFIGRFLLAGMGNILLLYDIDSKQLCERRKIFDKATIHGIQFNAKEMLVAIYGEKYVAIYKVENQMSLIMEFDCLLITTDWICNILWLKSTLLLTISAHNVATIWSYDNKNAINSSSCDEKCILYSATSVGEDEENVIVLSGTVFREIVIWSPFRKFNGSNILHRLQKHEGVIFSITVNEDNSIISSTSDDRSIVVWNVKSFDKHQSTYDYWKYAKITSNYSLYAHKARVWKSVIMQSGNILSAGEDGQICLKTSSITYQWEESRGSQVRSLDYMEKNNLVASGCTTGSIGLWSLDAVPRNTILTDFKTINRYPKHLIVLSNTNTYVLYSDGHVVLYKNNNSYDVYQNNILCCTITMTKSICESKITFTTSSGHIVIIKIKNETVTHVFLDKISLVKIVSSIWLNSNQIIVCCERNTIFLYEVFENLELKHLDTFCINSKVSSWITVAILVDCLIVAGCNEGSIYLFKLNQQEPLQVFSKIHSFAGVTAMWAYEEVSNSTKIISSFGRDGHHRYWNINIKSEKIFEVRCEILPTKWPCMITSSKDHGLLICGFKENNLIVYSSLEQRILATVFCGGGHRAWNLTFVDDSNLIYFVCSSSNSKLESKTIPLHGQHMLLKGFHSMIINSMVQLNKDLMITGSDDTTVRLTNFNNKIVNLLTLRSHISSIRAISCLSLNPNVYIIVTAGGRAQLKVWTLNIENNVYCEESVSHLLKGKNEKRPWRSVVPSNECETRFMDVCVQYTKSKSILISVGCSDAILRLYYYDIDTKSLSLIEESMDCTYCILKILKIKLNMYHYVLTADTKGFINFWDISKFIENDELQSTSILTLKFKHNLHQSGINCCDYLELENNYGLLATGGDDQHLNLSVFHYKDTVVLLCNVSISVHSSQVTGIKVFHKFVISTSVDQKIIFSSWSCDFNSKVIQVSPLVSYFTTVADIHGLLAQKIGDVFKVIVYGQGVETFCANMSSLTPSDSSQAANVERVTLALELGEGPHWDPSTKSLYFVDLHRGKINRYHPETNEYFYAIIEGYDDVTLIIPIDDKPNTFVVGLGPSIGVVEWDGVSKNTSRPQYIKLIDETPGNRLNDGKADATGRLWVGSMGSQIEDNPGHYYKHKGALYSVEHDGSVIKRLSNISISNGLAWSMDNKEFYFVDTYKFAVVAYDFDIVSGNLSNCRTVFDLTSNKIAGDPDGMTIDTDGNLWLACFNSNHILKINPQNGTLLMTVHLPAYQITSAAFGGTNMDELYVTTAGYQLNELQKSKRPYSGALFQITNTGSIGVPGISAKLHLCPENQSHII